MKRLLVFSLSLNLALAVILSSLIWILLRESYRQSEVISAANMAVMEASDAIAACKSNASALQDVALAQERTMTALAEDLRLVKETLRISNETIQLQKSRLGAIRKVRDGLTADLEECTDMFESSRTALGACADELQACRNDYNSSE